MRMSGDLITQDVLLIIFRECFARITHQRDDSIYVYVGICDDNTVNDTDSECARFRVTDSETAITIYNMWQVFLPFLYICIIHKWVCWQCLRNINEPLIYCVANGLFVLVVRFFFVMRFLFWTNALILCVVRLFMQPFRLWLVGCIGMRNEVMFIITNTI